MAELSTQAGALVRKSPRRRGEASHKSQRHHEIDQKHRNEAPTEAQTGPFWGPQGPILGPIFRGPNYPFALSGDGAKKRPWGPLRPTRVSEGVKTTLPFPGPYGPCVAHWPKSRGAPRRKDEFTARPRAAILRFAGRPVQNSCRGGAQPQLPNGLPSGVRVFAQLT